ncbi:MAG: short-chain dehydrogenase/reductase [Gemmatimonadetes bacterium]|jgi:NAD(P)-dependent dehydrogenase (short-subunit alcohol dehydrogenase family)|nr:short-chain dehydrogenase/reductase [Gemmatimonadota bacterium]
MAARKTGSTRSTRKTTRTKNPRERGAKPPFPKARKVRAPGLESELRPAADHGETSYRGSGRLEGKVALVTGADSGIGRAVALAFAREGADVAISYLSEEEDAAETVRLVEGAGRRAVSIAGDISREAHCRRVVERTVRRLGRLDILVNNAAFQRTHESMLDIPSAEFEYTFRTNVFAMFWLCQAALEHLPEGGVIINTASIQAYQPSPTLLAYASTKGAIVTFSKALSEEVIKRGIRVNVVAPGPVWTPLIPSTMPLEDVKTFGKDTPLGRPGQPAELAPAYVFLASDDSRYITGEVIGVTGGQPLP